MRDLLQQLAAVPGVVGCLASGLEGDVLASHFPPLFDGEALSRVAALLAAERPAVVNATRGDGALDLRYTGGRAVVRPFTAGSLLVVCTSAVDDEILGLSLEHAWRRLEKCGAQGAATVAAPAAAPARAAAAAPPEQLDAVRESLTEALMRQLGPIAGMVVDEAWAAWEASTAPTRAGLPRLVDALAAELDEGAARAQFLAAARVIVTREGSR